MDQFKVGPPPPRVWIRENVRDWIEEEGGTREVVSQFFTVWLWCILYVIGEAFFIVRWILEGMPA